MVRKIDIDIETVQERAKTFVGEENKTKLAKVENRYRRYSLNLKWMRGWVQFIYGMLFKTIGLAILSTYAWKYGKGNEGIFKLLVIIYLTNQ